MSEAIVLKKGDNIELKKEDMSPVKNLIAGIGWDAAEEGADVDVDLWVIPKEVSNAKKDILFFQTENEKDGKKVKLNKGDIQMIFDAFLETDYENRWETKPMYYFLRTLVDKYIFRVYTGKFVGNLAADVKDLHTRIKSFLNLYKY